MEIASIKGDTVLLMYHPSEAAADVGQQFTILEVPERTEGLVAQITSNHSLEYPGLQQEMIQRVLEERADVLASPVAREGGMQDIKSLKLATAKIRGSTPRNVGCDLAALRFGESVISWRSAAAPVSDELGYGSKARQAWWRGGLRRRCWPRRPEPAGSGRRVGGCGSTARRRRNGPAGQAPAQPARCHGLTSHGVGIAPRDSRSKVSTPR
jgi:hypothetical protein